MRWLIALMALVLATPVLAQSPEASNNDPRLQIIPYDAGQVVPLKVAARFQLTLIFGADERVDNVAIGDSESWQVDLNGRGDALFIKPVRSGGPTNMTVITDARIYSFELSPAYGPGVDTPFTVRFSYLDTDPPAQPSAPAEVGRYRLSGNRALRPAAIADDGVRTTIEWGEKQALPAVFAINARGQEILLDGQMRDGLYVIDAVHRVLLFRLDRQTARATRSPGNRR